MSNETTLRNGVSATVDATTTGSEQPASAATNRAANRTKSRRRKAPGKRWSANSTIQWLDGAGNTIRRDPDPSDKPDGAIKALVHYRLDNKPRRPTYPARTPAELDALRAFTKTLELAYLEDWPADDKGKPVRPTPVAPATDDTTPAGARPLISLADHEDVAPAPPRLTAGRLVEIVRAHQRRTPKRRGGGGRQRNTQNNYDGAHDFFLENARYRPHDPRLEVLGLQAGDEWVFDDPNAPIRPADILGLISIRATTNLRTRKVNERRLARWRNDLAAAQRNAGGGVVQVPQVPVLDREDASARTIEAFAQQLGVLLDHAYKYELIPNRLWTEAVKQEVPHAGATSYTTRTVPSRDEVAALADTIATITRTFRDRDGSYRTVTGERYRAFIWLQGRGGSRPEEGIAVRDSWVKLDPKDPRIELHHAEIIQPALDDQPRERIKTPLKHRAPGQIRVLRPAPQDREEFIRVLSEHRRQFVNPHGDADQYFFTTETGRPIDLSNFGENWWSPTRDKLFATHDHFANLPFRRLRAAAITDWLVTLRWSTARAADEAGNSQAIIEKHYKGVLDARAQYDDPVDHAPVVPRPLDAQRPVADLADSEIAARGAELQVQMAALRAEYRMVQDELLARFDGVNA